MTEKATVTDVIDIIDLEYLQKIQDSLGRIVGITTVLLDPQGVPLSQPTNIKAFCAMMQSSETGVQMCIKANSGLIKKNIETREPAIITCPNSGLQTAAVPIFFEDQYLGSWLIGQIRMNDVDETLIEKTAQKAGFSEQEAKDNMNILPVISEQDFNNILDFLVTVTAVLTDIVSVNATLEKQRKTEDQRIAYLAYNDQRLDVPNGLKLYEDLANAPDDTYMICFDVQGLSKINDVYGRDAGDILLRSVVKWVESMPEKGFRLYCVEGDDFVVLASGYSKARIMDFSTRIFDRFALPWTAELNGVTQNMYSGVHMGVLKLAQSFENASALLTTIQRVLALARREGGLVYFDQKMDAELERQIAFELELKSCILNNMEGFSLNYQPIVDAQTGRWVGLEALCRWTGPESGFMPPDVFIEAIEYLGLISQLTDWVLDEAIGQAKAWNLDQVKGFLLDINLSPVQLRDPELLGRVLEVLKRHGFPNDHLSLEITETAEVHFDEVTVNVLDAIQKEGIAMALDDFGTGYASFSNLNQLPIDCLKIDRSFVVNIEQDPFLQQTIRSMIGLAKAAGLTTVTEGVETENEWRFMKENGVDQIQGYYFSKPLPKEELGKQLNKFEQ